MAKPSNALLNIAAALQVLAHDGITGDYTPNPVVPTAAQLPPDRSFVDFIMGSSKWLEGQVCFGLITNGPEGLIVTIRGTAKPGEWGRDGEAIMEPSIFPGCGWHAGFGAIYRTLTVRTVPLGLWLLGIRSKYGTPTNVTVTGHSLGGPLAAFAAYDGDADAYIGFSSPKPADGAFRSLFQATFPDSFNHTTQGDIVPDLPFTFGLLEATDFVHCAARIIYPDDSITPPVGAGLTDLMAIEEARHAVQTVIALINAAD